MRLNHSHKNVIPRQARTDLACPESARNSRKFTSSRGFTIIELIIAVAIIVILSGIVLANYHASRRQQTLQAEAQKLASTLRKAQNMALAGETHECGGPVATQRNYGVFLLGNNYKLFVDCDEDGICNEVDTYLLEPTDIPSNITVDISLGNCYIFKHPDGSFLMDSDQSVNLSLGSLSKTVSVNKATGRISID